METKCEYEFGNGFLFFVFIINKSRIKFDNFFSCYFFIEKREHKNLFSKILNKKKE